MIHTTSIHSAALHTSDPDKPLREAAERLEASFMAEMLKSAGLGKTSGAFGGGAGEDQFASFLVDQYAIKMVEAGGIGLTESLFQSLRGKLNDTAE